MDYKNILKSLAEAAKLIQTWESQGYAPSIEKDIVLGKLRNVYVELGPSAANEENVKNEETAAVEDTPADTKPEEKFGNLTELMEQMESFQNGILAETRQQFAEMKESISSFQSGLKEETEKRISEIEKAVSAIEQKAPETIEESKPEPAPAIPQMPIAEPKAAKPAAPAEPPVLGFYSLPESLRMDAVHNLFGGDVAKAEIAVNKMCSLRSIDDLLIYIEEHYHWDPSNITAATLIQKIAKKF